MKNYSSYEVKIIAALTAIFAGALTIGIALGSKIIVIFGLTASVSALTYPITFLITDTIAEIWGKKQAQLVIYTGLIVIFISYILIVAAISLPGASFWNDQESYRRIFGTSLRIIIGGTVAYIVSQHHDVWAFHFWKEKTHGKHLWMRNNFSTWVSQMIDTSIFVVISFAGLAPLLPLIAGQYLIKVGMALLDTPLIYLLVGYLKDHIQGDDRVV